MNTDNFLIEENDIEFAQNICKVIENSDIRNRAVANNLASKIAERFFEKGSLDIDTMSGLHNIGHVLEDIDIADIYINGSYIDVRLYFNDEELGVPKSHFDNNLLPAAYMFIKITPDLSGATVTGFMQPEEIDTSNTKDGFIIIDETKLVSFYDIEPLLITKEDPFNINEADIFAYLENNIANKNAFYKSLIASKDGRLRLAKANKAQYAFNFISINNDTQNVAETLDNGLISDELLPDESITDDFADLGNETLDLEPTDDIADLGDETLDLEATDEFTDLSPETLDLEPTNDATQLEETDAISDDINDGLSSSLDTVDDLEPIQTADLDIIDEFNLDSEDNSLEETPAEGTASSNDEISELNLDVEENNTEETKDNIQDSSFEFSTVTSPSLNSIGDSLDNLLSNDDEENSLNNIAEEIAPYQEEKTSDKDVAFDIPDNVHETESAQDTHHVEEQNEYEITEEEQTDNAEQIGNLFNADETVEKTANMLEQKPKQKSSIKLLTIIGLLVVLGAVGYFGYNQFTNQTSQEEENSLVADAVQTPINNQSQEEAMPVESVESTLPKIADEEGTAETIPAIEQNLDASILVSNLKVDWEVPAGYVSNTAAKRYLVKLGKVIQLNLKTELLLLNKPPITNKIAVEIKYNSGAKKFEAVGVTVSSGEKTVDDLIMQTVNRALAMKLSANTDSFNNIQGNPVLIIHL